MPPSPGHVFWIFGLSGAGKSTVGQALAARLRKESIPVLALDGDILRAGLCRGLGFSDGDRAESLRRAAEVARLGATSGLCVVATFITPLTTHRQSVQAIVGPERISMIHANASLEVCRQRDVKGLYARAASGLVSQMTGFDSRFEPPDQTDLDLPTGTVSAMTCSELLCRFAWTRLGTRNDPDGS